MRPAREGRENAVLRLLVISSPLASMRPAREGRENARRQPAVPVAATRFNEARP